MPRPITFEQARAQYPHRYTMEHIPDWARKLCDGTGKYYAPQYRSDAEWYANTHFPGEHGIPHKSKYCNSNGQTWPLGDWLDAPYTR
jgi:hypothetical protein